MSALLDCRNQTVSRGSRIVEAWIKAIPQEKLVETAQAIFYAKEAALQEWKIFTGPLKRRMKVADRERAAYLHGFLHGLAEATRLIELRRRLEL